MPNDAFKRKALFFKSECFANSDPDGKLFPEGERDFAFELVRGTPSV
jgi:hypothetical protein